MTDGHSTQDASIDAGADLKGRRYGKMTVIRKSSSNYWLCRCDCGKERHVREDNLETTPSCGCSHKPIRHRHGAYKTSEYRAYIRMIERCNNPDAQKYAGYGGRDIKVCERWLFGFENFLADMGRKPTPAHEIDRIDNDGHYEPGNCRWATRQEQNRNTRRNRLIVIDGVTKTLTEWAIERGLKPKTVSERLVRYGWTEEQALGLAPQQGKKPVP